MSDWKKNLEFSGQIFTEVPFTRLQRNLSNGSHADTCGQTDGHDVPNRRHSRLSECTVNVDRTFAGENWKSSCPMPGFGVHGREKYHDAS